MKKVILFIAVIVMIAGFSSNLNAQSTQSASAAANIVIPIDLTKTADLHFGTMAVLAGTPGTCILSTANVRTATGGVNLSVQAPTSSNAAFSVAGANNTIYDITLPATITVANGAASMIIGTLKAKCASNVADGVQGTLSAGGADTFTIGGTLNVAAGQAPVLYTGTFNVTVAYN
jgi:hypothetical protein